MFYTVIILVAVLNFAIFTPAEAGFLSFIDKILGTDWSGENTPGSTNIETNSQTATLIQSVLNPNPNIGYGGGGISIVNQSALLADTGPLGSIADVENVLIEPDHISIYVVKEGDSLSQIADMFGVSANTIIWANDIDKGDLIKTGQVLIILPITGLKYEVVKGDTVASIAKKYKADADEIIRFNDLPLEGSLAVGSEIIIPDGEIPYIPKPVSTGSYVRGTSGPNYVGYYARPIAGGVKTQGLHGYNGVDLASYCGAPILASASGDVIIAKSGGWNGGYGNYIVIKHPNGTQTLYAHNVQNIVSAGWHVVKGQVIGYMGTTGKSTGCHVHFEIRGARNPF